MTTDEAVNRLISMTTDAAIIEDKQFRVDVDAILQRAKASPRKSRERSLAITKLQEAAMWFGMDLKELHEGRTIYPESYNPTNTVVEATADGIKL